MSTVLQGVVTTYLGPTNHKPARIVARTASGLTRTEPYDHNLTPEQAHRVVAMALIGKLGWGPETPGRRWVQGAMPHGYAFCCLLGEGV
jgi:hypothetical protein